MSIYAAFAPFSVVLMLFGYRYYLHWVALLVLNSFATVLAALCWPSPIRRCLARLENSHRPSCRAESHVATPASHSHCVTHSEWRSRFPGDCVWLVARLPSARVSMALNVSIPHHSNRLDTPFVPFVHTC